MCPALRNQIHAPGRPGSASRGERHFSPRPDLDDQTAARCDQAARRGNLRLIEELDKEVDLADSHIHKLFARDERVRRLLPIPGVGIITAAIVVAEVGEIARFPTARQFRSWCGLTPTEHSSAENIRRGHISNKARVGCAGSWWRQPVTPIGTESSPTLRLASPVVVATKSPASLWRAVSPRSVTTPCAVP